MSDQLTHGSSTSDTSHIIITHLVQLRAKLNNMQATLHQIKSCHCPNSECQIPGYCTLCLCCEIAPSESTCA